MNNIRRIFLRRSFATAVAACGLLTAAVAPAQFLENFDSYVAGTGMNGQGGWKGWDNDPAVANTATVNNALAFSSPNSVRVLGTSFTGGAYTDLVHQFSGYTSGRWIFSARQYIPSSSTTGTSYFILLDDYVDGGPNTWAVQTTFNLATGMVGEENDGAETPQAIIRNTWVELRYDINLTANTVTEYYNGVAFSTHTWDAGTTPAHTISAIDLYSDISNPVYYDSISISVIPEPGTATLFAALGLLGVICRLRRGRTA